MTTAATISAQLILDSSDYRKGLEDSSRATSSFQTKLQSLGSNLSSAGRFLTGAVFATAAVGFAALGVELNADVQAAMEAQQAQAQLNAILESTRGVAGITAAAVNELADAMSMQTGIDDEALVSAQSMMLTFTDIGKNVFPMAMDAVTDMSTAMNGGAIPSAQELMQTSIQLGKALQDPDKGLGALSRVGVNVDELRKKFNPLMSKEEKQILILQELQNEFGGSAEAAGNTFAGQLAKLQIKVGNFREEVGAKLLPALGKILDVFVRIASSKKFQSFLDTIVEKVGSGADLIARAVEVLANGGLRELFSTFEDGSTYIEDFLSWLGLSSDKANDWGQKISAAATWVMDVIDKVKVAFETDKGLIVATLVTLGLAFAAFAWSVMAPMIPIIATLLLVGAVVYLLYTAWTQNWGGIQEKTAAVWAWLQPILENIKNWLMVNMPIAIANLMKWWGTLSDFAVDVWSSISDVFDDAMNFINDLTTGKLGEWSAIWDRSTSAVKQLTALLFANIKLIFQAFQAAFSGDWRRFGELLRQIWINAWTGMKLAVQTSWNNIKSFLSGAVSSLKSWFMSVNWSDIGRNLIQSIATGLLGAGPLLLAAGKNVLTALKNFFVGFFGGGGGSTTFPQYPGGGGNGWGASGTNGWVKIPPGYPNDTFTAHVSSGERLAIVPRGEPLPGGSGGGTTNYYNATINYIGSGMRRSEAMKGFA